MNKILNKLLKSCLKLIFLLFCLPFFSQDITIPQDSLVKLDYDDLFIKMNESSDIKLRLVYADTFLNKAKIERDTSNIITGLEILAVLSEPEESLIYLDNIIELTEGNPNHFNPANAYLLKAGKYYKKLKYKESLDAYLKVHKLALKHFNEKYIYKSLQGIALIKNRIGDYESALKIHHKNLRFFEKDTVLFGKDNYLNTLFSISVLSLRLKRIDSSSYYNKIGFQASKEYDWKDKMNHFRLSEGVARYKKGEFSSSLDSISKSLPLLNQKDDKPNLIFAYYYLAQNYFKTNKEDLAINNLIKVDSLYQLTGILEPDTRSTYRQLNDYYESIEDSENQLLYLNKLIAVDSTYYRNQSLISSDILKGYDFPKLISAKERLISTLEKGKKKLYFLIVLLIVLIYFVFVYHKRKQRKLSEKFEAIINGKSIHQKIETNKNGVDIPTEIVDKVSQNLKNFEIKNGYVDSDITLNSLAKEIQTNSNYLSKIINHTKGKNFSSYLNELRIAYAIEKLKSDKSFKKYTINAIATEVGFKSAETFSKSFKSVTGLYPSYFIKKINQ